MAMSQSAIKGWYLVHKWTSLVCTLFLLMLCVTGLPLIFHEELEHALEGPGALEQVAPGTVAPGIDAIVAKVLASRPGEVVQFAFFDDERPIVTIGTAPKADSPPAAVHNQPVDLRTGKFTPPTPKMTGFLEVMDKLHTEMFAGVAGTWFLGLMGALFLAALVSGVVIYAPFMRKLAFGTVRRTRSPRLKWLDLHNMLGVVLAGWLFVVGATGVFNTLDLPLAMWWRGGQLAEMTAPYRNLPPPTHVGPVSEAISAAGRASPGMKVSTVSWPGTFFSTPHHYNVFMTGTTPVTSKLLKPSLVDAQTGKLTDTRDMPLLIKALFLSRPLHFGDYGELPLKIIWALLDVAAIVVLGSGVYLWLGRRRAPVERHVDEILSGSEA